jgi:antitoxin ParD1/3/4
MQVTLTPEQETFVDTRVASGDYRTREAVVAAGLTLLQRRESERARSLEDLKSKIASGLDQIDRGEIWDADEVFRELLEESRP